MKARKSLLTKGFSALSLLGLMACAPTQNASNSSASELSAGIIGGTLVTNDDAISKSTLAILDLQSGALCTGSLLTNNIVLSAAHCVGKYPKTMIIIFANDIDTVVSSTKSLKDILKDPRVRQVTNTLVSKSWATNQNKDKDTGDVSLIKFSGTAPTGYTPAEMLSDSSVLVKNAMVTLAGYGITNGVTEEGSGVLRKVQTPIADPHFSQTEVELDQRSQHGACHGDSGGPAFIAVNGKNLLWGITSRGVNDLKNDCLSFSAYTNAIVYKKMISDAIVKLNAAKKPGAIR